MDRPLLLLDIDGVLNPSRSAACPAGYREVPIGGGRDPLRIRDQHADWLTELSAALDLVWATGWRDAANQIVAPLLRLPRLPVVTLPPGPFDLDAKMAAAMAHVADRPAAWIDDQLTPAVRRWAAARTPATLLIDADPAVGLTRQMVDATLRWAAALR